MDISGNVRAECARAHRPQHQVASVAEIPSATWDRRMASGNGSGTGFTVAELLRVADALGIPVDRLFYRASERTAEALR